MAKIFALDPKASFSYVLKDERELPNEEQTIWELKHLNAREEELLENKLGHMREGDFHIALGTQNRIALDIGIVGVQNFVTQSGQQIEVKHAGKKLHGFVDPLVDAFVDRIPKAYRQELAQAILEGEKMGEEEAKN